MQCKSSRPEIFRLFMPTSYLQISLCAVVALSFAGHFSCSELWHESQCMYEPTDAPLPAPYDRHSWVKYLEPKYRRKAPDWIHKLVTSVYPEKVGVPCGGASSEDHVAPLSPKINLNPDLRAVAVEDSGVLSPWYPRRPHVLGV